ncbi:MAG: hypothetical protein LBH13_09350 [Cellulomonadaceae bacterium]|nr:hypothetical protein [Cellulomonadaceae bacterium]
MVQDARRVVGTRRGCAGCAAVVVLRAAGVAMRLTAVLVFCAVVVCGSLGMEALKRWEGPRSFVEQ